MQGALPKAVLTVLKCSGVGSFLYTCRFGQWVKLWAGRGGTSLSNRINVYGNRQREHT